LPNNCTVCGKEELKIGVTEGGETRTYCGQLHALMDMLKRYSKVVKANSKTNTVRAYQTASTILGKLSKAVEKEWKESKEQ
jgi:hypothetical protein